MKRLTTSEFKNRVYKLVGKKYTVLGKYINTSTKIKMRHNTKHPHIFYMAPMYFLRGERCPLCHGTHKKTTTEFKSEVYKLVGKKYSVLGKYKRNNTKILFRHNTEAPHSFYMEPKHFLEGHRCPICQHRYKRTTSMYKKAVYKLVKNKYTVLGHYVNEHTKIKMRHNTKHPHVFYTDPDYFLQGSRCPICFKTKKKTTSQFKNEVYKEVGKKYTVLGHYINNHTKIKIRHNTKHPHVFYMKPVIFLEGYRCPKCFANFRKTTKIFKKEVFHLVGKKYTVLGKYINTHTKIKMKHNTKHPHTFYMDPDSFLAGRRCPLCTLKRNESNGERLINKYLKSHGFKINKTYYYSYKLNSYKYCHRKLSADFYIPKLNLIIEFDGRQHRMPVDYFGGMKAFIDQVHRDRCKDNYCSSKNLLLLRIEDFSTSYKEMKKFVYKIMPHFLHLAKLNESLNN